MIAVDHKEHIVVIKGAKNIQGTQLLKIRDSAKNSNNSGDIWIENRVTNFTNQMNLSLPVCVYFTLS